MYLYVVFVMKNYICYLVGDPYGHSCKTKQASARKAKVMKFVLHYPATKPRQSDTKKRYDSSEKWAGYFYRRNQIFSQHRKNFSIS